MEISNNVSSYVNQYKTNNTLEKIATGLELNRAANDASSLVISDKLRTQSSGYVQAISNTNSAIASTQIADRAISEQSNILNSVKEKLLQASTDTTSQEGREALLKDVQNLLKGLDSIGSATNYNGESLLQSSSSDQSASQAKIYQTGTEESDTTESNSVQANTVGLGLSDLLSDLPSDFTAQDARDYLSRVDDAIGTLNDYRSDLGSTQNQLASTGRNLLTQETQTSRAESELSAANIARSLSDFNKQSVLSQAGAYTQSQFNITQQSVLRLLT
ncbi:flagellin [Malaciobacter molluscorum LMG 25693]|uniref:Flagellin n=1 Tax=Malaciobacter molluscorum LMG 25693 TaxID=870501 RepID=A0A2G1DKS7_9BACT|nr:flagellin [Malaciobacter molluscorum]AXX92590.1 putative flagellar protein [Malaciobacter molluscorum LMG 25693]PHO19014.1 flagellin [Malaciobacter molluscorum LMG 25693]RXJ97321.1 flagellin [Malaciobacter molluscorum]